MASARADDSPGYNPLSYRDPVGDEVVRNLSPGAYSIVSPNGFTIWVDLEDLKPLLRGAHFSLSRKGHIWARLKRSAD